LAWSTGKPGPTGWVPWIYWTEKVINDYWLTHKGPYTEGEKASILGWAASTAILFAIPSIVASVGLSTVGWVSGFYFGGKWSSQWIDSEEGKDNYHGFISGGGWPGSNDPNYLSGDPNKSGYFNVFQNTNLVIHGLLTPGPTPEPYWSKRANTWVSSEAEADEVLMRQLRQSVTSGSFTTPEALYRYGYISSDEYVRRITARQQQASDDRWAKKRKAEAKKKWDALSKDQQKDIVATQRAIAFKQQMLFAPW